jgi:hypothetical protein
MAVEAVNTCSHAAHLARYWHATPSYNICPGEVHVGKGRVCTVQVGRCWSSCTPQPSRPATNPRSGGVGGDGWWAGREVGGFSCTIANLVDPPLAPWKGEWWWAAASDDRLTAAPSKLGEGRSGGTTRLPPPPRYENVDGKQGAGWWAGWDPDLEGRRSCGHHENWQRTELTIAYTDVDSATDGPRLCQQRAEPGVNKTELQLSDEENSAPSKAKNLFLLFHISELWDKAWHYLPKLCHCWPKIFFIWDGLLVVWYFFFLFERLLIFIWCIFLCI